jgi:uncharacterized protein
MYIEIDQISPKGLVLNDSVALTEDMLLEDESFFLDEIVYNIHLNRDGSKIRARGRIKTMISIPCVNCLEPFDLKIDSSFDIILFPAELIEMTNASLTSDDMEYIFFEGDRIDLMKILMEQVNLFIPYKPVCSPDCRGLCPSCGANLNNESCQCEASLNEVSFLYNKIKR